MEGSSAFGEQLRRLADLRGFNVGGLAGAAAVPEAQIVSVLGGAEPAPTLLRGLAPVLGMHRSDLFVVAGLPVPDDLAPLDASARNMTTGLAWPMIFLPSA